MAQNARKMDGQHHESSEITCGGRVTNGKQLDEIGHRLRRSPKIGTTKESGESGD